MKKFLFIASVAIASLCSCSKNDLVDDPQKSEKQQEIVPSVTINSSEPTIESKGGDYSISFTASTSWTAIASVDWIIIEPTSGNAGNNTIKVTVKENTTYDQRDGLVMISASTAAKGLKIVQKQVDALLLTSNIISIDEKVAIQLFR